MEKTLELDGSRFVIDFLVNVFLYPLNAIRFSVLSIIFLSGIPVVWTLSWLLGPKRFFLWRIVIRMSFFLLGTWRCVKRVRKKRLKQGSGFRIVITTRLFDLFLLLSEIGLNTRLVIPDNYFQYGMTSWFFKQMGAMGWTQWVTERRFMKENNVVGVWSSDFQKAFKQEEIKRMYLGSYLICREKNWPMSFFHFENTNSFNFSSLFYPETLVFDRFLAVPVEELPEKSDILDFLLYIYRVHILD